MISGTPRHFKHLNSKLESHVVLDPVQVFGCSFHIAVMNLRKDKGGGVEDESKWYINETEIAANKQRCSRVAPIL